MKLKRYSMLCLAIITLAAVCACNNVNPEKFVGTALGPKTDLSKLDTTKYNNEYLLYSTAKINGVLPLESKFDDFIKVVGKPDSLIKFNSQTDCQLYEEPYQYIYFQGNMFFLVKDTAIFEHIDFRRRPDLEIETSAITLNVNTTLQDIQKLFPKAVSKLRSDDQPGLPQLRSVDINGSKLNADEWWILLFDGNKLVSVQMYGPC
jgi:hypothetical protein